MADIATQKLARAERMEREAARQAARNLSQLPGAIKRMPILGHRPCPVYRVVRFLPLVLRGWLPGACLFHHLTRPVFPVGLLMLTHPLRQRLPHHLRHADSLALVHTRTYCLPGWLRPTRSSSSHSVPGGSCHRSRRLLSPSPLKLPVPLRSARSPPPPPLGNGRDERERNPTQSDK